MKNDPNKNVGCTWQHLARTRQTVEISARPRWKTTPAVIAPAPTHQRRVYPPVATLQPATRLWKPCFCISCTAWATEQASLPPLWPLLHTTNRMLSAPVSHQFTIHVLPISIGEFATDIIVIGTRRSVLFLVFFLFPPHPHSLLDWHYWFYLWLLLLLSSFLHLCIVQTVIVSTGSPTRITAPVLICDFANEFLIFCALFNSFWSLLVATFKQKKNKQTNKRKKK